MGAFLHSASTARPIVGYLSRDRPENHPPSGELRPQGKNSSFLQQSGIFRGKSSLTHRLITSVFGPSKNLRSPYGNTVGIAVTLDFGGNGSKVAKFSHSARPAHGASVLR